MCSARCVGLRVQFVARVEAHRIEHDHGAALLHVVCVSSMRRRWGRRVRVPTVHRLESEVWRRLFFHSLPRTVCTCREQPHARGRGREQCVFSRQRCNSMWNWKFHKRTWDFGPPAWRVEPEKRMPERACGCLLYYILNIHGIEHNIWRSLVLNALHIVHTKLTLSPFAVRRHAAAVLWRQLNYDDDDVMWCLCVRSRAHIAYTQKPDLTWLVRVWPKKCGQTNANTQTHQPRTYRSNAHHWTRNPSLKSLCKLRVWLWKWILTHTKLRIHSANSARPSNRRPYRIQWKGVHACPAGSRRILRL